MRILIIVIFTALTACGFEKNRISLIEEKSGIELPMEYEILKNESIDVGSTDGDFSIYIELKFDEANFQSLLNNIERSEPPGRWTDYRSGKRFSSTDDREPTTIEIDTIKRTLNFKMNHI